MISTKRLARLVGVEPETVRRWVRAGKVTPAGQTPGGHYRFRREQAEELLAGPPNMSELAQDVMAHVDATLRRARRRAMPM